MNVRNAFYQAASQRSNVIKTENYFQNIKVPNYGFTTEEEAEFSEHLFKYLKFMDNSKKIEILKAINSLSDIESNWKFFNK
jgi:hypothetical protein